MEEREHNVPHFLDLIRRSRRGKFKVYIGMIAGVGKTYRMLQEAHEMMDNGIDVQIGYVETHGRARHRGAVGRIAGNSSQEDFLQRKGTGGNGSGDDSSASSGTGCGR